MVGPLGEQAAYVAKISGVSATVRCGIGMDCAFIGPSYGVPREGLRLHQGKACSSF
jgi:hypothetical protein